MSAQDTFLKDIILERAYQSSKWGGSAHDDAHSWAEFGLVLGNEVGEAFQELGRMQWGADDKLRAALYSELVQVAAVCCAMAERLDRELPNVSAAGRGEGDRG